MSFQCLKRKGYMKIIDDQSNQKLMISNLHNNIQHIHEMPFKAIINFYCRLITLILILP